MKHLKPIERIAHASTAKKLIHTRPIYLQVRDALLERIASGEWAAGAMIPNEAHLAQSFGVSAGTMRKALQIMTTERVLQRRQGLGTYVNDQTSRELETRFCAFRDATGLPIIGEVESARLSDGGASGREAGRLRLPEVGSEVWRVRRLLSTEGRPFMVEETVLPRVLFPRLTAADAALSLAEHAQRNGLLLGKAEEAIMAATAAGLSQLLGCDEDDPILVLDRVMCDLDGQPLEWRVAHCLLGQGSAYRAELA